MELENYQVEERKAFLEFNQSVLVEDIQKLDVEYQKYTIENVVLVKVYSTSSSSYTKAKYQLQELRSLSETAGANPIGALLVHREDIDKKYYIGKGKLEELKGLCNSKQADTVIFDNELQPSQRKAVEDFLQIKVLDRTQLILDIFALHAKSNEGKLQVELAQAKYMLPRLRGWGEALTRMGGGQAGGGQGMGSRGPGETKLELDRRVLTKKISHIKKELEKVSEARTINRKNRTMSSIPKVALVGYTNTGKSSILKLLSGYDPYIENALFATVDTNTKRIENKNGFLYLLSDTVGFVSNLPHELIESFKATFEEALDCDILVHIVDASTLHITSDDDSFNLMDFQIESVNKALEDIRSEDENGRIVLRSEFRTKAPRELLVFNKVDLLTMDELQRLKFKYPKAVFTSVKKNIGIEELNQDIINNIIKRYGSTTKTFDYSSFQQTVDLMKSGKVVSRTDKDNGIELTYLN